MTGIINVLKPPMMTSNGVVGAVKKLLKEQHVGHTGTLDPNAAGVLPVCIGKATKVAEFLLADEKEYVGEMLFGMETDTCDTEGSVLYSSAKRPTEAEVLNALEGFRGEIRQIPPMYSSIKIDGKRAYEIARQGKSVEIMPRQVEIKDIQLVSFEPDRAQIWVRCSKGTYIRSLVRDLGRILGCYAVLSLLIRTRSGMFVLDEAHTLEEVEQAQKNNELSSVMICVNDAMKHFTAVDFDERLRGRLACGNALPVDSLMQNQHLTEGQKVRVLCSGELIGLGEIKRGERGLLIVQPTKVLIE